MRSYHRAGQQSNRIFCCGGAWDNGCLRTSYCQHLSERDTTREPILFSILSYVWPGSVRIAWDVATMGGAMIASMGLSDVTYLNGVIVFRVVTPGTVGQP